MRVPRGSAEPNSFQHAARISLKQSMLKIGHLAGGRKPPWAQGVGGSNPPAPTNRIKHIDELQDGPPAQTTGGRVRRLRSHGGERSPLWNSLILSFDYTRRGEPCLDGGA